MRNLIKEIKQSEEDFEFYPTTKEIVQSIYNDLAFKDYDRKSYSILDVGCGNGNFFTKFQEIRNEIKDYHKSIGFDENSWYQEEKWKGKLKAIAEINEEYGIEKSEILIQNLPPHVIVVGTDFWENTLIDKKVDIIFSNPPYSEYEEWSAKIIREAYCKIVYLVIPDRWKNSKEINAALKLRNFGAEILGSFDFLNAERSARAKVDVLKITKKVVEYRGKYYEEKSASDPFEIWFNQEFKINLEENNYSQQEAERKLKEAAHKQEIKNEVAVGRDLVQVLVGLYQRDMMHLLESYKKIAELDPQLLKELGVDLRNIKTGLKKKIEGLKYKYWHEFFDNFDKIKNRLISSKREKLLSHLHSKTSIDFTTSNIYAIVIWVIKNANQYFEEQIKEIYLNLTETEYVKKYKSNNRTWEADRWRYKNEGSNTHYCLDYRIITRNYKNIIINDVRTIANNLGFNDIGDVKTFQNGNVHFRFQKDFIKAFNIEAARLFGWIKSPQEATEEFPEECSVTEQEAKQYFKGNFLISSSPQQLLLN